jgi:hypothetical protein
MTAVFGSADTLPVQLLPTRTTTRWKMTMIFDRRKLK